MTVYSIKTTILSLCVGFASLVGFSQNPEADSLKILLSNTTVDSVRVYLMYKISDAYSKKEPLIALDYADTALNLAREINFDRGEARSLTRIGNLYSRIGEFDTSLSALLASLKLSEEMHDEKGIAASYNNIALMYTTRNLEEDYRHAIVNFISAKAYYEKLQDSANLCTVLLNIGDGYEKMNMLDSASFFSNKAKAIAIKIEDYENLGVILINLGYVDYKREKYREAMSDFHSGIYYMEKAEDDHSLATAWYSLSLCFDKTKKPDSAIYYANKSVAMAKSTLNYPTLLDAATHLSKLYAAAKKLDSAYVYEKLASQTDNIINNNKAAAKIEQLKYQELARQQRNLAIQEAKARSRIENIQKVMIVGFIVTLFILIAILSRRRINKKAMQALSFLSLLLAFEFITFIIHPIIEDVTHHNPIYMVLILAGVAGILGPLHHRLTHWFQHKLGHKHPEAHKKAQQPATTETVHHKQHHVPHAKTEHAHGKVIPEKTHHEKSGHHVKTVNHPPHTNPPAGT